MFLRLTDKSYIKYKPDSYIFSSFKDGYRDPAIINESAAEILALCDGTNTLQDIVAVLSEKYDSPEIVKENVNSFLDPFIKNNLIETIQISSKSDVTKGSQAIYYPDVLIWEITDYCPLMCKHCYWP